MDEGRNWECLFIYEALTRHLVTRNLLKIEGGMELNLYILRNRHRRLT